MAASFAFVPRIVSKHAKPWQGISTFPPSRSPSPEPTTDSEREGDEDDEDDADVEPSSRDKGKGREKAVELANAKQSALAQDIATLVALALSDYSIWLDPDLRRKLDACLNDEASPDGAGFVPINYLRRRAPFRGSLPPVDGAPSEPSETEVVKALRTHASQVLEVRMRTPSSSSIWYGTGKTSRKKDVGGYEVRRKDWSSLRDRPSCGWTHARWDNVTIYMEGIPPSYRTVGSIVRFVDTLLSSATQTQTAAAPPRFSCVQNVTLPPHYLDKPGDISKCKGYALVTLSAMQHAKALLHAWPWKRRNVPPVPADDDDEAASQITREAYKYGVRAISKARWDALNEEYLLYKRSLVDEISTHSDASHANAQQDTTKPTSDERRRRPDEEPRAPRRTTAASSYPFDCLVFVRNVRPDTNKTTLRVLFGHAFEAEDDDDGDAGQVSQTPARAQARPDDVGLDYVDFTKGMDTCFLRLASSHHAARLMVFFGARDIAQADGLDALGRTPLWNDKPIVVEMVQGKKEELYWEKVPEKVRRQAVERALEGSTEELPTHTLTTRGQRQGKRARKS